MMTMNRLNLNEGLDEMKKKEEVQLGNWKATNHLQFVFPRPDGEEERFEEAMNK